MSLDVTLTEITATPHDEATRVLLKTDGRFELVSLAEWTARFPGTTPMTLSGGVMETASVFEYNITHNLGAMAEAAGIYQHLWRPEEINITRARQLVEPLREGLTRLRANPDAFRAHNPPNGWGSYSELVTFVEAYLDACECYPEAVVTAYR